MGGTTSGERIQLRGRPRAHRRPPGPIGDAHGLRLVRGDPGRGLKPQRVLPRAVRTRSSGRPGGSARRVGHGQGVGQGGCSGEKEEETRRGARHHTAVSVRPPLPHSRHAQRPRRRRPGRGQPGGGITRGGHAGGPGWIRGGKEEETRRGARQHWSVVTPDAIERASQLSGAQCCVINLYHHVINTNSPSLVLPFPLLLPATTSL